MPSFTKKALFSLLLAGCAAAPAPSPLAGETRRSISQFAIVNTATNSVILEKLGEPNSKGIYSDGRYSYVYTHADASMQDGVSAPQQVKIATFIFSPDGILRKWNYDENFRSIQRSKFSNLMDAGNSETSAQGEITPLQYEDLRTGASSGRVFSECGKPLHAQDEEGEDGMEKWIYKDADDATIHYYLLFQDNRLQGKYRVRTVPYRAAAL